MAAKERKDVLQGRTKRIKTGCGNMYVTVNFEEVVPIEIFARLGKAGGCASSQTEAIGRLATLALRHGAQIEDVIKQLSGIGCQTPSLWGEEGKVLSCADGIARCLMRLCPKPLPLDNDDSKDTFPPDCRCGSQ